jgi:hypothetical protein
LHRGELAFFAHLSQLRPFLPRRRRAGYSAALKGAVRLSDAPGAPAGAPVSEILPIHALLGRRVDEPRTRPPPGEDRNRGDRLRVPLCTQRRRKA